MEESERDIELERRRDTEFGEWAQSRTGGAVRGGERVKGVEERELKEWEVLG